MPTGSLCEISCEISFEYGVHEVLLLCCSHDPVQWPARSFFFTYLTLKCEATGAWGELRPTFTAA
jgi:hypothetical protein